MSTVRSEDELNELLKHEKYRVTTLDGEDLMPRTYFVLRSSDLFGAAALYAYAAAIATQIEFARSRPGSLSPDEAQTLERLEEMATDLALEWQRSGVGRVPD
jgi:hypothetical protein